MKLISVKNLFHAEVGTTEPFEMEEDITKLPLPEEIEGHKLSVHGKIMRLDESVMINGKAEASLGLICDRCLDNFDTSIKFSFDREYLLDRKEIVEENLYVDKHLEIDLTDELRDEIILAIPTQNICRKECGGICLGCGVNLNQESCKCKISKSGIEE